MQMIDTNIMNPMSNGFAMLVFPTKKKGNTKKKNSELPLDKD